MARLETEMAVLSRRVEASGRRSTTFRDMDRASYVIARTLEEHGPRSINEIARSLGLDSSTITRHVATMEARGQVARNPHPDDGRVSVISLTGGGRRTMTKIGGELRRLFGEWLVGWSTEDLEVFAGLLRRFNNDLAGTEPAIQRSAVPSGRRTEHRQSVVAPRRRR